MTLAEDLLSEEQREIREAAREFAEREFPNYAEEYDRREEFPFELWRKACKLGFVGVFIPEEYGGSGYGMTEYGLISEEFWRVDAGLGLILSTTFGSEQILLFGSEEQKEEILPRVAKGDAICCACFTEPGAGSDVAEIKTTAKEEENFFVINGNKVFITNGSIADYYIVLTRTDKSKKRHHGLSVFIVEKGTEGLEARKLRDKLGIRASDTAEVFFKNVRVPKENLVGERGRGFYQAVEFFNVTRIHVAFQAVGIAQGAFELALEYAKNRELFERKLIDFQITREKLAKMRTEIEAARLLAYQAAMFHDKNGKPDPGLTAMAKYYAAKIAQEIVSEALQIFGGHGFVGNNAISRMYRNVKVLEIYEGSREVEIEIVANSILGKYNSVLSKIRRHPMV